MLNLHSPKWKRRGEIEFMTLLTTKTMSISIHRISKVDIDTLWPHDHGLDFLSIGLTGRYTEELYLTPATDLSNKVVKTWKAGSAHVMRNNRAHRIIEATEKPSYTLFLTWNYKGEKTKMYTKHGYMSAGEYYGRGLHLEDILEASV